MIEQKRIEQSLKTACFGKYLYVLPEIDSTNTYAREKAREGAPEGSVIIADYQTNGRGTRGRLWESSPGENILMSIILRPKVQINATCCFTLATATILIKAITSFLRIEQDSEADIEVKWPNDILLGGGKLAGILTESSVVNQDIEYLIVGMGINVNQDLKSLSPELRHNSNSLYTETGVRIEREKLIAHILSEFEQQYIVMENTNYNNIVSEWKKYWRMQGRKVRIETPLLTESGEVLDINPKGSLVYRTETGKIKEIIVGTIYPE